jgi:hypothetical protein
MQRIELVAIAGFWTSSWPMRSRARAKAASRSALPVLSPCRMKIALIAI